MFGFVLLAGNYRERRGPPSRCETGFAILIRLFIPEALSHSYYKFGNDFEVGVVSYYYCCFVDLMIIFGEGGSCFGGIGIGEGRRRNTNDISRNFTKVHEYFGTTKVREITNKQRHVFPANFATSTKTPAPNTYKRIEQT